MLGNTITCFVRFAATIAVLPIAWFLLSATSFGQIYTGPDSVFREGEISVTFSHTKVNPEYFCEHQWPDTSVLNSSSESLYIEPSLSLILDTGIVSYLNSNNAVLEPVWSQCANPCNPWERFEISGCGDTLWLPYWNEYIIHFPDTISPTQFTTDLVMVNYSAFHAIRPIRKVSQYEIAMIPFDPLWSDQASLFAPSLDNHGINVEGAWNLTTGNPEVKVGILDVHFESSHSDFWHYSSNDAYTNVKEVKNFAEPGQPPAYITNGHGLKVSAIAGALRNNRLDSEFNGVAGIAGGDYSNNNAIDHAVSLYFGQVLRQGATGEIVEEFSRRGVAYADALREWTQQDNCSDRVRVFNMSFFNGVGWSNTQRLYETAQTELQELSRAYRRCAIIVNAKRYYKSNGNTDPVAPDWRYDLPSGFNDQWVIGVGMSKLEQGALHQVNSFGGNQRLLAPGLATTAKTNGWGPVGYGTSFAAPQVTGVASLILSRAIELNITLLNDDVAGLMEGTATKARYHTGQLSDGLLIEQTVPYDPYTGFGIVNAFASVARVPDVQRGYVDLSTLTNQEFDERVVVSALDPDVDGLNADYNFRVIPIDVTDPFIAEEEYSYAWQRVKIEVNDVTVGSEGQSLDHVWGIGMGHNLVPNTTGWEEGVVYINQNNAYKIGTQTPYAKVNYSEFDGSNRRFSIFTYLWKVRRRLKSNPTQYVDIWYPVAPRDVKISYGYLLSGVAGVSDAISSPSDVAVQCLLNPSTGQAITVRMNASVAGEYSVALVNSAGVRVLDRQDNRKFAAGSRDISLDVRTLPSGVYLCEVRDNQGLVVARTTVSLIK